MAGGRRAAWRGSRGEGKGAQAAEGQRGARLIDSRPRDTLYLSSHRSPFAGPTKKEIGFADFDPFVFGQRPALRAGAEKCEGALIGCAGPAPRTACAPRTQPPRKPPRLSSRAVASRVVWVHYL
ncbi:jg3118 [Pararge aegeria aegeria]|uniref:Jg3118 protein n=1 Tax=Pararge aegeria aegeria TaxID=348720 RepID=A0A8S4RGX5_9NEOP|nr:jg3118 [Pararge aegeria aegeria]